MAFSPQKWYAKGTTLLSAPSPPEAKVPLTSDLWGNAIKFVSFVTRRGFQRVSPLIGFEN